MATKSKARRQPSLIAQRVEAERVKRGWTYDVFAEKTEAPKGTVHAWCHSSSEPNVASLRRIAKAFGCEISDLVDGTSAPISKAG